MMLGDTDFLCTIYGSVEVIESRDIHFLEDDLENTIKNFAKLLEIEKEK